MRQLMVALAVGAILVGLICTASLAAEEKKGEMTVTGYVTDSMCKGEGAKEGHKDCALKCAREKGAKLGVWDPGAGKFYALEDQKKAEEFAGEMVTVKGSVDQASGSLKASSIAKAEKKST